MLSPMAITPQTEAVAEEDEGEEHRWGEAVAEEEEAVAVVVVAGWEWAATWAMPDHKG